MSSCSDTCGCCSGVDAMTPRQHDNRPGLPTVDYRAGSHYDFRASMRTELAHRDRHPTLAALRTRADDDPTIALIDAWAMACDVLTFYTERLANESFLRTASDRVSLQELGRLVAYRLNPGAAAETPLAFAVEAAQPAPARPPSAGSAPAVAPVSAILPAGLRVQSVPGADERPQTFETVEQLEARPEWNAMPVVDTRFVAPHMNQRRAWFTGTSDGILPGQALLLASADLPNDRWDVRIVTKVFEDTQAGSTEVEWDRGLGSFRPVNRPADTPEALILRKRLRVFGHQAPIWKAMDETYRKNYLAGAADTGEWPGFTAVTRDRAGNTVVDVDGAHPEIVDGAWVVLSQEDDDFYRELHTVVARSELSRAEFAISTTVTRLVLKGEWHDFATPRDVTVLAVGDRLELAEEPDKGPVDTAVITVEGDATTMLPGRRLLLVGNTLGGRTHAEAVLLEDAHDAPGGPNGPRTELTLKIAPEEAFARKTCTVLGNVAMASHGETVSEILGNGDARRSFQRYTLRQLPLSYAQATTPSGIASTLTVRVGDVLWKEVASAHGTGPTDRAYTTSTRPDGGIDVVFGDGVNGRRLPTGSQNVRATYRKGLGLEGNVRAGTLSQLLDRPLGLNGATNPMPARGGASPEPPARARSAIPLPVRTLGRAVSLRDYSDFALAFTGVGLADTAVLPLRAGRTIVVTIAGPGATPAAPGTIERLAVTLRAQGDPHVNVVVVPHTESRFTLELKIGCDPDFERAQVFAAVEAALRGAFSPSARRLGQMVHRSEVIAVAAAVRGVMAVDLDLLYLTVRRLEEHLVARPAHVSNGKAVGVELIALADVLPPHWIQAMTW